MNTIRCLRGNVFRIFQGSSASFGQDTNPNPEISENKRDREGLGIVNSKLYEYKVVQQCISPRSAEAVSLQYGKLWNKRAGALRVRSVS